jgi:ABC-type nickel/cobalt efflux system permease component RcnA
MSHFSKSFVATLMVAICSLSLFFSTASFIQFYRAHQDLDMSSDLHHESGSHTHRHHHDSSGAEHSHSHDHMMLFMPIVVGLTTLYAIIFILPLLVSRIRPASFLIHLKLNLFSIFRPPKRIFSINT